MAQHILERLAFVIEERRRLRPPGSYVVKLLDSGREAIGEKVKEEAAELAEAGRHGSPPEVTHEAADLLFHALVLLAASGVSPAAVWGELERRFGTSGLEEKASRGGGR